MCLYPTIVLNPKYKKNKKNRGNIPRLTDPRAKWVPIGCKNCIECRKQKAREWQVRLLEEIKVNKNGKFVCLTFSNKYITELYNEVKGTGYEKDNNVAALAVRRFLERWRKSTGKSVRHWLVTELGTTRTEHLHLHGILFTNESAEFIQEKWKYGNVWQGYKGKPSYVNAKTINYVIKYVTKYDIKHRFYKQAILCSAGIGRNYTETEAAKKTKFNGNKTKTTYTTETGHQIAMPIYWRNKIYTEKEREKLWMQQLDKGKRYVLKQEIDVTTEKGEEEYKNALIWAQKINTQKGYGKKVWNWDLEKYENERRKLKQLERAKPKITRLIEDERYKARYKK
jgi:hypothetical protein